MTTLSQFFPSGSTSGGGGTNIGGGTIPVEILGVSGGGGSGSGVGFPSPYNTQGSGGEGGYGAFFHANNYYLNPGTTYPITVGSGGNGGTASGPYNSTGTSGTPGGYTSFNNPLCPIRIEGGGGGGLHSGPYDSGPHSCCRRGYPGGTGGGGGQSCSGGCGLYFSKDTFLYTSVALLSSTCGCFGMMSYNGGIPVACPWGCMSGYNGAPGRFINPPGAPCQRIGGCGGRNGNSTTCYYQQNPTGSTVIQVGGCNNNLHISNSITGGIVGYGTEHGVGGPLGSCGACSPGCSGTSGVLIIKWPSSVGAAPPTGFPGATNISPQTPGYYTYCFTSSGSITLP